MLIASEKYKRGNRKRKGKGHEAKKHVIRRTSSGKEMSDDNFAHVYISHVPIDILAFIVDGLSGRPRESFLSVTVNSDTRFVSHIDTDRFPIECAAKISEMRAFLLIMTMIIVLRLRDVYFRTCFISGCQTVVLRPMVLKKIALLETFA